MAKKGSREEQRTAELIHAEENTGLNERPDTAMTEAETIREEGVRPEDTPMSESERILAEERRAIAERRAGREDVLARIARLRENAAARADELRNTETPTEEIDPPETPEANDATEAMPTTENSVPQESAEAPAEGESRQSEYRVTESPEHRVAPRYSVKVDGMTITAPMEEISEPPATPSINTPEAEAPIAPATPAAPIIEREPAAAPIVSAPAARRNTAKPTTSATNKPVAEAPTTEAGSAGEREFTREEASDIYESGELIHPHGERYGTAVDDSELRLEIPAAIVAEAQSHVEEESWRRWPMGRNFESDMEIFAQHNDERDRETQGAPSPVYIGHATSAEQEMPEYVEYYETRDLLLGSDDELRDAGSREYLTPEQAYLRGREDGARSESSKPDTGRKAAKAAPVVDTKKSEDDRDDDHGYDEVVEETEPKRESASSV